LATLPSSVHTVGDGSQRSDSLQHGYADGSQVIGMMLRRLATRAQPAWTGQATLFATVNISIS
jgi:hypothetical protein